tara:strand:- start:1938 stop:2336 length:399 start_codon:yes stop_codon:yes gene_type:complete
MKTKLVGACALVDLNGRVLINQRPKGKDFEGFWEFPGGKVENDENPEDAVIRELKEEIDIDVNSACLAPLSFSEARYNDTHVLILLYIARKWEGIIKPLENQKIVWVKPKDISAYEILPADKSFFPILRDLI